MIRPDVERVLLAAAIIASPRRDRRLPANARRNSRRGGRTSSSSCSTISALGHARLRRTSLRQDAADRPHRQRGREFHERLLHDVAVLAEPRVAPERRLRPQARRDQQLHRVPGTADQLSRASCISAATRPRMSASTTWARGTTSRGRASTTSSRTKGQGKYFGTEFNMNGERREVRQRLLHHRRHRHRARLAAARSRRQAVDDDPRPQGAAQLLHAGAEVRERLRRRQRRRIRSRRFALDDKPEWIKERLRHMARHLRPALRMAQEVSRRSARSRARTSRTWCMPTGGRSSASTTASAASARGSRRAVSSTTPSSSSSATTGCSKASTAWSTSGRCTSRASGFRWRCGIRA